MANREYKILERRDCHLIVLYKDAATGIWPTVDCTHLLTEWIVANQGKIETARVAFCQLRA